MALAEVITITDKALPELLEHVVETTTPHVVEASPPLVETFGQGRRRARWTARLAAADVGAMLLAGALTVGWNPLFIALAAALVVLALRLSDLYRETPTIGALDQLSKIGLACGAGTLTVAAAAGVSSLGALTFAAAATLTVGVTRSIVYRSEVRRRVRRPRRVIVVGTGPGGQELVTRLLDHPELGMTPVGFVDGNPQPLDPQLSVGVIGSVSELLTVVGRLQIEVIVVDAAVVAEADLLDVLDRAARLGVEVTVLPALARHLSTAISVDEIAGLTLLSYRPSRHAGVSWFAKRVLDVTVASLLLLLSLPIWLVAAAAIKLDSRGTVLFKQERIGRYGRAFRLLKFRSMVADAESQRDGLRHRNEADGPLFKIVSDPRVTRVGRIIRRFSIDELPQLINVIRGDMSLVGPRPVLPCEAAEYPDWFRRRLDVPPGMSGLWQVSGRFLLPFDEAQRLDLFYVDHWSFGLDLKILTRTGPVVLTGRGAR